jgi:hypothetical protein
MTINQVRRLANDLWAQTALFACVLVILVVLAAKYVW